MPKNNNQPPRNVLKTSKAETLRHDPKIGEVDPRTYPLLGLVRFESQKIPSNERFSQLNRLSNFIDRLCEAEGEKFMRCHFTLAPGADARKQVEVRLQPLSQRNAADDLALAEKIKAKWPEIIAKGVEGGVNRWFQAEV